MIDSKILVDFHFILNVKILNRIKCKITECNGMKIGH